MCLALPGKIVHIEEDTEPKMATVDFGGIKKNICLELVPEANLHDFVLVHVGLALTIVDEKEALETIAMFNEMGNALDEIHDSEPA